MDIYARAKLQTYVKNRSIFKFALFRGGTNNFVMACSRWRAYYAKLKKEPHPSIRKNKNAEKVYAKQLL
jgi:hypothetical protein